MQSSACVRVQLCVQENYRNNPFHNFRHCSTLHVVSASTTCGSTIYRSTRINDPSSFHNFRHCFCVTQMMYGFVHLCELWNKLSRDLDIYLTFI